MDAFFFSIYIIKTNMTGCTKERFTGCAAKRQTGAGYKEKFEAAERMKTSQTKEPIYAPKVRARRPRKTQTSFKSSQYFL